AAREPARAKRIPPPGINTEPAYLPSAQPTRASADVGYGRWMRSFSRRPRAARQAPVTLILAAAAALLALIAGAGASLGLAAGGDSSSATPGPWLGLNGNSAEYVGPVEQFVEHNVIYDRSGAVELIAGETLAQDGAGLDRSIRAGMIPVIPIEFDGYQHC